MEIIFVERAISPGFWGFGTCNRRALELFRVAKTLEPKIQKNTAARPPLRAARPALPPSITNFQLPSRCRFQTVMYLPKRCTAAPDGPRSVRNVVA
jgi:hypothetical protein